MARAGIQEVQLRPFACGYRRVFFGSNAGHPISACRRISLLSIGLAKLIDSKCSGK
jgi:hypothetical protein